MDTKFIKFYKIFKYIFFNSPPLEEGLTFHFNKQERPSPRDIDVNIRIKGFGTFLGIAFLKTLILHRAL